MIYKELLKFNPEDPQIYARIDDDGICRVTCTGDNPEFLAWLAEGNTPLPADKPTTDLWEALRAERDRRLAETDWVVIRAVDLSNDGLGIQLEQVWVNYRQALRDLPANTTDPANPVWPVKPTSH